MKKFFILFFAFTAVVFAEDAASGDNLIKALSVIAGPLALGIAALGGALAMGNTASATILGTARNPGIGGKITTTMFIAMAMIEAQVIYALVICMILLYANPLLG